MLKYFFVMLNLAFMAGFVRFAGSDNADVKQTFPQNVKTNSEFFVELLIKKPEGALSFGKLEQSLPKGFVAVPENISGGVFSQDENEVVKIVWYELPKSNEFSVKLKIIVTDDMVPGDYSCSARFAYLENNEKKGVKGNDVTVKVEQGEMKPKEKEAVQQVSDTTFHRLMTNNIDKMLQESGVACTQVSEMTGKDEVKVEVRIIKGKVTGFCKIEESVCEGLTPVNIENGGGVFSFTDGKVKYVWTDMAAGNTVNVSFKLIRSKEAGWLKNCSFDGEFSYLENDKSMKCKFNTIAIDFEKGTTAAQFPGMSDNSNNQKVAAVGDPVQNKTADSTSAAVAANNTSDNTNANNARTADTTSQNSGTANPTGTAQNNTATDNNSNSNTNTASNQAGSNKTNEQVIENKELAKVHEMAKENNQTAGNVSPDNNAKTTDSNQTAKANTSIAQASSGTESNKQNSNGAAGLVFKVQVCATHKQVDAPTIKNIYKLPEEVNYEMHEGWNKFTVGGFPLYSQARDKRENLGSYNLPGPFVTAYNNGLRITVQEALMISKQQWVK